MYLRKIQEAVFHTILGLVLASVFFGQALTHLFLLIFLILLFIFRPKNLLITPFWWLLAFAVWEFLSDYLGPHHGNGMESAGIGYHFLILLLPLSVEVIKYKVLLIYLALGAIPSSILMWLQASYGVSMDANMLHLKWGGDVLFNFNRALSFNSRIWIPAFIHSLFTLFYLNIYKINSLKRWLLLFSLLSGIILPQTRAIIGAFIISFAVVYLLKDKMTIKKIVHKLSILILLVIFVLASLSFLRPNSLDYNYTKNNRVVIFVTSFYMFKEHPLTGLGGGEYFKEHYKKAWNKVDWGEWGNKNSSSERFGHTHNEYLMLLVHHGWPALFFWLGFIVHSFRFVWLHGDQNEKYLYLSLVLFHFISGLAETYLDYSLTTYAIFLCYGLALHGPIKKFKDPNSKENNLASL